MCIFLVLFQENGAHIELTINQSSHTPLFRAALQPLVPQLINTSRITPSQVQTQHNCSQQKLLSVEISKDLYEIYTFIVLHWTNYGENIFPSRGIREGETCSENSVSQLPASWAYLLAAASRYLLLSWCCLIVILTFVISLFQDKPHLSLFSFSKKIHKTKIFF